MVRKMRIAQDPLINGFAKAQRHRHGPQKATHPCYSGLQVQGTADSPVSMAIFCISLSENYITLTVNFQ
jgi:hypothetical protein